MRMATIFNEFLDRKACRNFRHLPKYCDLSGKFVAAHATDVPSFEKHGALRGFCKRAMQRNNVLCRNHWRRISQLSDRR